MNEPDVIAVLTEVATLLTDRGNGAFDDAAVLEQKGGPASEVAGLRDQALVDVEAARRIRGLESPVRRQAKRGPKPGAPNGNAHTNGHLEPSTEPTAPSGVSGTNTPTVTPNRWGG